jgi:hypothetical protein
MLVPAGAGLDVSRLRIADDIDHKRYAATALRGGCLALQLQFCFEMSALSDRLMGAPPV